MHVCDTKFVGINVRGRCLISENHEHLYPQNAWSAKTTNIYTLKYTRYTVHIMTHVATTGQYNNYGKTPKFNTIGCTHNKPRKHLIYKHTTSQCTYYTTSRYVYCTSNLCRIPNLCRNSFCVIGPWQPTSTCQLMFMNILQLVTCLLLYPKNVLSTKLYVHLTFLN